MYKFTHHLQGVTHLDIINIRDTTVINGGWKI